MVKSILGKAKILLMVAPIALFVAFRAEMGEKEWLEWSNKCLTESFDASSEAKIKKWEIELTPEHFIRLRKTYQRGKQAYFSFNLNKLDSINYVSTTAGGLLKFRTAADDIIVQTYNDRKGNIDSMSSVLTIPVKGMSPQRLDSLNEAIRFFKTSRFISRLPWQ
jgi:hypothetical protein